MDGAEWDAIYREHYPALVRRLTMVVRDRSEAEDLAQTTYLRAFRARDRFQGSEPRAWLYTIGLRLALNELRRRRRQLAHLILLRQSSSSGVTGGAVWAALDTLSRPQRAALLLTAVDGYSQEEVARILGVPTGTVASWLSRSKARLRGLLEREYDDAI